MRSSPLAITKGGSLRTTFGGGEHRRLPPKVEATPKAPPSVFASTEGGSETITFGGTIGDGDANDFLIRKGILPLGW